MKKTEEYLYDLLDELGKTNLNTGNVYKDSKILFDIVWKYATLIDVIKIMGMTKPKEK